MSPAGAEQRQRQRKNKPPSKKLSIDKREVVELFFKLDELDETLLKKAVSFIGQTLESAEEGAVKVELINITEANHHQDKNEEEQVELPSAGTPEQGTTEPITPITTEPTTSTTEATETTVEAPAIAVPSLLKARGVAPSPMDLIPFNKNCFSFSKKCGPRSKEPAEKAKTRAVRDLVIAMCDESLTLEQQVYVLCAAVKHHDMKLRSASAGILPSSTNKSIDKQIVTNIHDTI